MSWKKAKQDTDQAIIEAFHALSKVGDEILLPLSITEDVLKRSKKSNEITSYLHRFDFGDFFLSLIYTPARSDLTSAPSTLEARICLDKTETLFFFMPYDIIPFINPQDMICRYFPYIESPERLASCYRDLAESLVPYLSDFQRIATDPELLIRSYSDLKAEMTRCYGEDINRPSGKGEEYDTALMALRFAHFVKWKSSFYSSYEYASYLSGDASALSATAFRGTRPDYVKHLALTAIGNPDPDYLPVREESASLPAMMKAAKKARTLGILLLTLLITLPVTLLVMGALYFGIASIVGANSVFYSALTLRGFLSNAFWIGTMAIIASFFTYPFTLRLFFKKRYLAFLPYHRMAKKQSRTATLSRTHTVLLIAALLFTVFSACRGVHFTENSILVQSAMIPRAPQSFSYEDIVSVEETTRKDGSFFYIITFEGNKKLSLESVMEKGSYEAVAEILDDLFAKNGITVGENGDETPPDEIPNQDNTNKA